MKWLGKNKKARTLDPEGEQRNAFAVAPLPRPAGPPASSTPLADHLAQGWPGVDREYVVLPRSLAEQMPLPWQRTMTQALGQFHREHGQLDWPVYRVLPSRTERLTDLDEGQLAEAGYMAEIDAEGSLVYRERNGRKVDDPDATTAYVTCHDPIASAAGVQRDTGDNAPDRTPVRSGPAAMNVGPEPVWSTDSGSRAGKRADARGGSRYPFSQQDNEASRDDLDTGHEPIQRQPPFPE